MTETFGQMLRRLREAKTVELPRGNARGRWTVVGTMSQNELARRAEVDTAYVHRMERDRLPEGNGPSPAVVSSLARGLALSPIDTDRLLIAAGYWPWLDGDDVERALAAVHGDCYGERRMTG